jgi:hypothetical protein
LRDFVIADRFLGSNEQVRGKFETPKTYPEQAVEFIDVGTVLVGDINPEAVVGKTDAFGIQAAIVGVARDAVRVKRVRTAGEKMLEKVVLRWHTGPDGKVFTGAVNQRGQAEQQRGVPQFRRERERKAGTLVGFEVHSNGVEAWNVGSRIVDEGVEGYGVRATVGEGEEGAARCIGDT